ncbi:MAG: hypothetical protein NTY09_02255 [bacterium]|nr:hypothetical protein [bacterium]
MKKIILIVLAGLILLSCQPVFGAEEEDFILNEIAEWTNVINSNSYTILDTWIGEISSDDLVYTLELAPGTYYFYGAGGLHVTDIDAYIADMSGIKLDTDDSSDKIPKMKIKLDVPTTVQLVITPFSYEEGYSSDYVCFLLAAEGEGGFSNFEGDVTEAVEPPPIRNLDSITLDEVYREEMQFRLDEFLRNREEDNPDITQSGIFLIDGQEYSNTGDLGPGIWSTFAMVDSRVKEVGLDVLNGNGDTLATDSNPYRVAHCLYGLLDPETVEYSFNLTFGEEIGANEAYAFITTLPICGIDDESRRQYVTDEMDGDLQFKADSGTYNVIESDVGSLNADGSIVTFEYDLDEGKYVFESNGGPAISDMTVNIFDSSGTPIYEDNMDYNFTMAFFELTEPTTITVEVSAAAFLVPLDEDYYYYTLSKINESEE